MAIVANPYVTEVVTTADILEVEEMLRRYGLEFGLEERGAEIILKATRVGSSVFRLIEGGAIFVMTAVFAEVAVRLNGAQPQYGLDRRTKRRVRCELCLSAILSILNGAKEDVRGGYYFTRALGTKDEERKTKFNRSRA